MPWIKQQLLEFLCPLLAYRPEQALKSVTQCYMDSYGNQARLTMN